MQTIIKDGIKERLDSLDFTRIEVGCGPKRKFSDSVTIDRIDLEGVDIVADLDLGIPLDDASVDEIRSSHFLEHVGDLAEFMRETQRVLKPNGRAVHVVPHFANPYFYSDYTHHTFFGLYSFNYFSETRDPFRRRVPSFYNDLDFEVASVRLRFKSPFRRRHRVRRWFEPLVNLNAWTQEFHEEHFCWLLPPYEIRFELVKR